MCEYKKDNSYIQGWTSEICEYNKIEQIGGNIQISYMLQKLKMT